MRTADEDFIRPAFIEKKRAATISSIQRPNKQYRQLALAHAQVVNFCPFGALAPSKIGTDKSRILLVGYSVDPTPLDGSGIPGTCGPFEPFGGRL